MLTVKEEFKYLKIDIDLDTIYIREELYGIILDEEKLNNITKSSYVAFFQFFNERYKKYPLVLKNDNKYLTIVKTLLQGRESIKAEITKLPGGYMGIDMSHKVTNKGFEMTENARVIPDVKLIFSNI